MVEDSKNEIKLPTYDPETGAPENYYGDDGHRKSDPRLDEPTLPETPVVHLGDTKLADVETHKLPTAPLPANGSNDEAATHPVTPILPIEPPQPLNAGGQKLRLPSK